MKLSGGIDREYFSKYLDKMRNDMIGGANSKVKSITTSTCPVYRVSSIHS